MTTLVPKFEQPYTGAINRPINKKLQEVVSCLDFGALGDGSGALVGSAATGAAWNVWPSFINGSNYLQKPGQDYGDAAYLAANPPFKSTDTWDFVGIQLAIWTQQDVHIPLGTYVLNRSIRIENTFQNIYGDHWLDSKITMLNRDTFPAINATAGKPLFYYYRMGLAGAQLYNIGFSTTYTTAFDGDAATVPANFATATSCIAFNDCDTLFVENVFCSGTGEMGLYLYDYSTISLVNFTSEYYSAHIMMTDNCIINITDSTIYNTWGNNLTSFNTAGVMMTGPNNVCTINNSYFYEFYYGGIYSTANTNTIKVYGSQFTNTSTSATPGTGRANQVLNLTCGTCDIQENHFYFGNYGFAPIQLTPSYPSIVANNYIGSSEAVTWGALNISGSEHLISNNIFALTQVGSPSAGGNIVYSQGTAHYNTNSSKVLFSNNVLQNQKLNQIALNGVLSNNTGTETFGTINLTSGFTSGTAQTLVAPGTLASGSYLIDFSIGAGSFPYIVSASGIANVNFTLSSSQGNGLAIPLAQTNFENVADTISINPTPGTNITNGFVWTPNFTYSGTDAVLTYKIIKMA